MARKDPDPTSGGSGVSQREYRAQRKRYEQRKKKKNKKKMKSTYERGMEKLGGRGRQIDELVKELGG